MSKLDIVSCDCGCGKIESDYNAYWGITGWIELKCPDLILKEGKTDSILHFASLSCLRKWVTDIKRRKK